MRLGIILDDPLSEKGTPVAFFIRSVIAAGVALIGLGAAAPAPVDLSRALGLPAGWQLLSRQGPSTEDPGGNQAPGELHLCITSDGGRTCRPGLDDLLHRAGTSSAFDTIHYLEAVRIVRAAPDRALLWVQAASLHGGNGDQLVGRAALRYDPAGQRFVIVYRRVTGRNNNQDVRFIGTGPLRGAIVSAEPTQDAPFAFWITVDRPGSGGRYTPVLRYRSVTRYGDGNGLPVIDSDMPEILRRLKLWQPGQAIPLPDRPCPRPRLINKALWCAPPRS